MFVNKRYLLDMPNASREISNLCRFCLGQDGLIPVSKATASLLTIQDIVHFTGVQITEEEQLSFAMCVECCKVLENAVCFRSTCQENNFVFKQLFAMLIESVKDKVEEYEDTTYNESEPVDILTGVEILTSWNYDDDAVDTSQMIAESYNEDSPQCSDRIMNSNAVINDSTIRTPLAKKISSKSNGYRKPTTNKNKPRLCAICGKLVTNMKQHQIAYHSNSDEKPYSCPHCPLKMVNSSNRKRHIESVHEKKIVKTCEICDKGFRHKTGFEYHMKTSHGVGDQTYKCKLCSETFDMPQHYKNHKKRWHKTQKEFNCSLCGMIFKEKIRLKIHQRVHSDDQPYACSLCPKRFKSRSASKTHELTHTGVRFSCNLCERSYRYKSLLNIHYRKDHDGAMPSEAIDD